MKPTIIILSTNGASLNIAYSYLSNHFNIRQVIVEESVSRKKMIQYRVKKLGWLKVLGQLQFIIVSKLLLKQSKERRKQILKDHNLEEAIIPKEKILNITSVNTKKCRNILKKTSADFILVNGTRIIGKKTLDSTNKKFINIHAGITPKYRGVHGGYWALVNNDSENCGVTLHYVDAGVDTGSIIAQTNITPNSEDNFTTYPLLQQIAGLKLLSKNYESILNNKSGYQRNDLESLQWYHPTLAFYLKKRITKGIK